MPVFKCNETLQIRSEKTPKEIKALLCRSLVCLFVCLTIKISLPTSGLVTTDEAELKDNSVNEACP